jgi:uncharacterized protein YndB with AHSA1/START domain
MINEAQETSVHAQVIVEAPIEQAFTVFTEGIGTWFPPEYNLLPVPIAERVFEPRVGGRLYDRGVDGSECQWGRVLQYERPKRVVISWDISPRWQIEPDLARTSEVEVRFIADGTNRTRVELEHRHLERHGEGWQQLHESVSGDGGWPGCLRRFVDRVNAVRGAEAH